MNKDRCASAASGSAAARRLFRPIRARPLLPVIPTRKKGAPHARPPPRPFAIPRKTARSAFSSALRLFRPSHGLARPLPGCRGSAAGDRNTRPRASTPPSSSSSTLCEENNRTQRGASPQQGPPPRSAGHARGQHTGTGAGHKARGEDARGRRTRLRGGAAQLLPPAQLLLQLLVVRRRPRGVRRLAALVLPVRQQKVPLRPVHAAGHDGQGVQHLVAAAAVAPGEADALEAVQLALHLGLVFELR